MMYSDRKYSESQFYQTRQNSRHPRIFAPGQQQTYFQRQLGDRGMNPGSTLQELAPPKSKNVPDWTKPRERSDCEKEILKLIQSVHGDLLKRSLYIGGLPVTLKLEKLSTVMSEARCIRVVDVLGRRSALVEFSDAEHIKGACTSVRKKYKSLTLLSCKDLHFNYDNVEFQITKLYVEGSLENTSIQQLQEILPGAAMISAIKKKSKQNQTYDIWFTVARFEDIASARIAFTKSQGILINGKPLLVTYCARESSGVFAEPLPKRSRKESETDAITQMFKQEFVITSEHGDDWSYLSGILDERRNGEERRMLIGRPEKELNLSEDSSSTSTDSSYQ